MLRHTIGLILGIVVTPVILYGSGWAGQKSNRAMNDGSMAGHRTTDVYYGIGVMAAVGLVIGVVLLVRQLSPFASLVPALVLLAWTIIYVVNGHKAESLLPRHDHEPFTTMVALLGLGLYALIGLMLLVPSFMPSRWITATASGDHAAGIETFF